MSETTTTRQLQLCLDRLRRGDAKAYDDLFGLVHQRLTILTRKMLHGSYPRLRQWEETADVAQNAQRRLFQTLKAKVPQSAREFYGLANLNIRRELLDLCRHHFGRPGHEHHGVVLKQGETAPEPSDSTHNPERLSFWAAFHERVEELPPEEREVVGLLWYQELSQDEAAEVLAVDRSTVKRRWRSARLKLADVLKDWMPDNKL
jgi:RNA polymerase sigma-70 factor (ECF subfamily)